MARFIDLIGQKFGILTVLKRTDGNQRGYCRWLCKCICGKEKIISSGDLKSGNTKSCGCLRKKQTCERFTTHGHLKNGLVSKTYHSWLSMIQRCTNPHKKDYKYYGGRGIIVCKRWMKFENFLVDMDEPPTKSHSIDRIDNDGNYCKSNCRWATRTEQQRNTRRSHMISYGGKTQCISAWAEELNIHYSTLCSRIFILRWSIEKALKTPIRKRFA